LALAAEPPTVRPSDEGGGNMNAPDELIVVATFETTAEASVARTALEAAGITAIVPAETAVRWFSSDSQLNFTELQVRAADRQRAQDILKRAGHR
jgi:hypothetical protein